MDINELEERLRKQKMIGYRTIVRVIEDTPGDTATQKLKYWKSGAPRPTHSYGGLPFMMGLRDEVVEGVLDELALEERRSKPSPAPLPPDPVREQRERALETAIRQDAKDAALAVYEKKRAEAVAELEPTSEEYKRRWARWTRLIEEEMKR